MSEPTAKLALRDIALQLQAIGVPFALVGGLAVGIRGEARFTRDVDLALIAETDAEAERIVFALRDAGYVAVALVEHLERPRLATARLASPSAIIVDLIVATSGIEREVVERARPTLIARLRHPPAPRLRRTRHRAPPRYAPAPRPPGSGELQSRPTPLPSLSSPCSRTYEHARSIAPQLQR